MRQPLYAEYVYSLHQKYGKMVRLGPRYVSVADPAAVPMVLGTRPTWEKVRQSTGSCVTLPRTNLTGKQAGSYHPLGVVTKGKVMPGIVSITSEDYITNIKKGVGNAFATYTLLDYERVLDESQEEVIQVFRKRQGAQFDMIPWLFYFTIDAISRIAFSETPAFVSSGSDVGNTLRSITERFEHWARWGALPALERIIYKNSLLRMASIKGSPLGIMASDKLQARSSMKEPPAQKDLLAKFMDAAEKHPEAISTGSIISLITSTIAAGSDTTALTLSAIFYFLMKNPEIYSKLLDEFKSAAQAGKLSNPPQWNEVNVLPYLDVVIKEALRVYPVGQWSIDRIVPKGGATLAGKFLPEDTVVGFQQLPVHRDKEVYGEDAESFRPERWLEANSEQRQKMEKGFISFSAGKRICLGMHIAQMELKKFVPHMLMNFKV